MAPASSSLNHGVHTQLMQLRVATGIDLYWEHSPLRHASNVKTSALFLVGEAAPRVPMPQSVEMYRALKSNGVPTRLRAAPREGHGWTELPHVLFRCRWSSGGSMAERPGVHVVRAALFGGDARSGDALTVIIGYTTEIFL